MPIIIKSEEEIATNARGRPRSSARCSRSWQRRRSRESPANELDKIVRKEFAARGVEPTFLGYQGYPASVCVSINDEVVHGIPDERELKEGDIVSIDLGATLQGVRRRRRHHRRRRTDQPPRPSVSCGQRRRPSTRGSRPRGRASPSGPSPMPYRRRSKRTGLLRGAGVRRARRRSRRCTKTRRYRTSARPTGACPPKRAWSWRWSRWSTPATGARRRHDDGWTVSTLDGSLSAHFEHTIAITDGEAEILTLP